MSQGTGKARAAARAKRVCAVVLGLLAVLGGGCDQRQMLGSGAPSSHVMPAEHGDAGVGPASGSGGAPGEHADAGIAIIGRPFDLRDAAAAASCGIESPDKDLDGFLDHDTVCLNGKPAGDDCDDWTDTTYPGAPELCNGSDDDCDGKRDEAPLSCAADVRALWPTRDGSSRRSPAEAAQDADGNSYWVGSVQDDQNGGSSDGFVASFDSKGTLRWSHRFGSDALDDVYRLELAAGSLYLLGYTYDSVHVDTVKAGVDVTGRYVMRIDAKTGDIAWVTSLMGPPAPTASLPPWPMGVAGGIGVDAMGEVYVGGEQANTTGFYARIGADGTLRWLDSAPWSATWDVVVAPDGSFFLLVQIADAQAFDFPPCDVAAHGEAAVMAFDADGTCLWAQQTQVGSDHDLPENPLDSQQRTRFTRGMPLADGGLVVAGTVYQDARFDGQTLHGGPRDGEWFTSQAVVLNLDSKGSLRWIWQDPTVRAADADDLAVDADGAVLTMLHVRRSADPFGYEDVPFAAVLDHDGELQWWRDAPLEGFTPLYFWTFAAQAQGQRFLLGAISSNGGRGEDPR
jgi:hypothetical protein